MTSEKTEETKLRFAMDAAQPALKAAAAHKLVPPDPEEAEFRRDMELAGVVNSLGMLCGPNLRVLNECINTLLGLEDEDSHEPVIARLVTH
jgi:hypothetical protein